MSSSLYISYVFLFKRFNLWPAKKWWLGFVFTTMHLGLVTVPSLLGFWFLLFQILGPINELYSALLWTIKNPKRSSKMRKDLAQLGFFFFSLSLWRLFIEMVMAQNTTIPVNVGLVLDFDTSLGKMGLTCIPLALSDFYASHGNYKTSHVLKTRDSRRDVGAAAAGTLISVLLALSQ